MLPEIIERRGSGSLYSRNMLAISGAWNSDAENCWVIFSKNDIELRNDNIKEPLIKKRGAYGPQEPHEYSHRSHVIKYVLVSENVIYKEVKIF